MYKRYHAFVERNKTNLIRWSTSAIAFAVVLNLFQRSLLDAFLLIGLLVGRSWQNLTAVAIACCLVALLVMAGRAGRKTREDPS